MSVGVNVMLQAAGKRRPVAGAGLRRRGLRSPPPPQGRRAQRHGLALGEAVARRHAVWTWRAGRVHAPRPHRRTQRGDIGFATCAAATSSASTRCCSAGNGERIEITHKMSSRSNYAEGSLRAAHFLAGKAAGPVRHVTCSVSDGRCPRLGLACPYPRRRRCGSERCKAC